MMKNLLIYNYTYNYLLNEVKIYPEFYVILTETKRDLPIEFK